MLILTAFAVNLIAQTEKKTPESNISWQVFTEGFRQAKKEDKPVLIAVYTDWSRWCKEMDKTVFTEKNVINFINTNFIPIKLNAEAQNTIIYQDKKITQREFVKAMGVHCYPTSLFFKSDGILITRLPGSVDADIYADVIEYISISAYEKMGFQEWRKKKKPEN